MASSFWTASENFKCSRSETLRGFTKRTNMFFESNDPINRDQIIEICNHLLFYPEMRFVKVNAPNLTASFESVPEAEDYLNQLVSRKQRRNYD